MQRSSAGWRRGALGALAFSVALGVFWGTITASAGVSSRMALRESSWYLRGKVVVVDPGHGGGDPGAIGVGGSREKDLTLQIAQKVAEELKKAGAKPVLTRDKDDALGDGLSIREELRQRVKVVEQTKADLFVSVHANKDRCACKGAQTFYQRKGMVEGQKLAHYIQEELRKATWTRRVALPIDHFVLRINPVPAATVEVGFLSNAQEEAMLKDPTYQAKLARAIVLGLGRYVKSTVPEADAGGTTGK